MVKSGSFTVGQGSLAGRLGSGVGKGLAEQLPKEIQHQRLSEGLKDFAENSQDLSPLEAFSKAASIYGATPQMIQALPEVLKYQNERNSAIRQGLIAEDQDIQPQGKGNAREEIPSKRLDIKKENLMNGVQDFLNKSKGITSGEPIQVAISEIRPPTQGEIFNKRSQILKQNPWMSVSQAQAQAEDYFDRINAQKKAKIEQGARQEAVESSVEQKIDKELDRLSISKNLSPERKTYLRNKAEEDVLNGMSPTKAARKWSELGNQEAKDKDEFDKMSRSPLITQNPKIVDRNLRAAAKTAKALEKSAEYSKNLQSDFGTSKEYADSIAYDLSNNKDLFTYASKKTPHVGRGLAAIPDKDELNRSAIKDANETYKHFKSDDSFNSFVVKMKEKDPYFDDVAYKDRMLQLYEEGKLSLTPEQKNELEYTESSWLPNLYDWWMKLSRGL